VLLLGKLQSGVSRVPQTATATLDDTPTAAGPWMWMAVGGPVRSKAESVRMNGIVGEMSLDAAAMLYWYDMLPTGTTRSARISPCG